MRILLLKVENVDKNALNKSIPTLSGQSIPLSLSLTQLHNTVTSINARTRSRDVAY